MAPRSRGVSAYQNWNWVALTSSTTVSYAVGWCSFGCVSVWRRYFSCYTLHSTDYYSASSDHRKPKNQSLMTCSRGCFSSSHSERRSASNKAYPSLMSSIWISAELHCSNTRSWHSAKCCCSSTDLDFSARSKIWFGCYSPSHAPCPSLCWVSYSQIWTAGQVACFWRQGTFRPRMTSYCLVSYCYSGLYLPAACSTWWTCWPVPFDCCWARHESAPYHDLVGSILICRRSPSYA